MNRRKDIETTIAQVLLGLSLMGLFIFVCLI